MFGATNPVDGLHGVKLDKAVEDDQSIAATAPCTASPPSCFTAKNEEPVPHSPQAGLTASHCLYCCDRARRSGCDSVRSSRCLRCPHRVMPPRLVHRQHHGHERRWPATRSCARGLRAHLPRVPRAQRHRTRGLLPSRRAGRPSAAAAARHDPRPADQPRRPATSAMMLRLTSSRALPPRPHSGGSLPSKAAVRRLVTVTVAGLHPRRPASDDRQERPHGHAAWGLSAGQKAGTPGGVGDRQVMAGLGVRAGFDGGHFVGELVD